METFIQPRSISSLWVQIAIGVSLGIVIGGVTLYLLWLAHLRIAFSGFTRELPHVSQRALPPDRRIDLDDRERPDQMERIREAVRTKRACPAGSTAGAVNGEPVCVSPSGRVVPVAP